MRVKIMTSWPYEPKVRLKWSAREQRWYFDASVPMSLRTIKAALREQAAVNRLNGIAVLPT